MEKKCACGAALVKGLIGVDEVRGSVTPGLGMSIVVEGEEGARIYRAHSLLCETCGHLEFRAERFA